MEPTRLFGIAERATCCLLKKYPERDLDIFNLVGDRYLSRGIWRISRRLGGAANPSSFASRIITQKSFPVFGLEKSNIAT